MLTSWYTCYDGMTFLYMYKYMPASACIDFSLLFLNPYIVKNQCVYKTVHTYVVIVNGIQEGTHKRFSRAHPMENIASECASHEI